MFAIDSWDNESITVKINGQTVISEKFHYSTGTKICGAGWKDNVKTVKTSFARIDTRYMYAPSGKFISWTTTTKNIWEYPSKNNNDRVGWHFIPV